MIDYTFYYKRNSNFIFLGEESEIDPLIMDAV